ncbi:MAG: chromosomal replication initiator protein DnaA [Lachnospiraceae bacterium]|nr:chromosomal replication initiator protein DnaA [Lachnospiraceae bacterium]
MENIVIEKWDEILEHVKIEHEIVEISFNLWLSPIKVFSVEDNTVTLLVENSQYLNYIKKKYADILRMGIIEVTGIPYDVVYVTQDDINNIKRQEAKKNNPSTSKGNINPKYTFDTFVVGSNNKMAHAACVAVAESPAEMYNPLFIYGGVGLGKTHLMHSIANFVIDNNPDANVLYVTSEVFTNDLIDAIRNKNGITTTEFREKYRTNDILLIDDIQFIIGKESTQEEFFHTFNALHEAKKQIIISSDKPPKDIETLEERLRSRFEWGLTVDLQSPDFETRTAILRKKNETEGYNIDDSIIEYIANNVKSNIRELEGALNKIVAFSSLEKKEITLELAEDALKDLILPNESKQITPELIMNIVAEHYNVPVSELISRKRNQAVTYPRHMVMYLCRNYTDKSLKEIGSLLGNRDHSTIINGCEKIEADIANNINNINTTIEILKKKINPN